MWHDYFRGSFPAPGTLDFFCAHHHLLLLRLPFSSPLWRHSEVREGKVRGPEGEDEQAHHLLHFPPGLDPRGVPCLPCLGELGLQGGDPVLDVLEAVPELDKSLFRDTDVLKFCGMLLEALDEKVEAIKEVLWVEERWFLWHESSTPEPKNPYSVRDVRTFGHQV